MKIIKMLVMLVVLVSACTSKSNVEVIPDADFTISLGGNEVGLYTLSNDNGATVQFTNYGARIVALWVPDRDGEFQDVVWGYSSIKDYLGSTDIYCGPIVGRFGNRINKGQFALNGNSYQLSINNGDNHLHGGSGGFECKVWDAETIEKDAEDAIKMIYISKDGEEGYPGNLTLSVTYSLSENNELVLEYEATSDAPTLINPTSHAYFNLSGTSDHTILGHILQLNADAFTPTDAGLIPTGEVRKVIGTPLDFNAPTAIGASINDNYEPLIFGKGYDHNYVLNKDDEQLSVAAIISSPESGIEMTVLTDQPAIQFYSGNFMDGKDIGKRGDQHNYRTGFALEAQNYPDAPNHANFPSAVLNPDEVYQQTTIYRFSIKDE